LETAVVIDGSRKRVTRLSLKNRRREIEERLAGLALPRGPRRLLRGESAAGPEQARFQRLRYALTTLGPVFSAFGLYLSSRADLLPVHCCLELANIPDTGPATPVSSLRKLVAREIDTLPEESFEEFQSEPFESGLLSQLHRGRLNDGAEVVVHIIHPELEIQLPAEVEMLSLLGSALAEDLSDAAFNNALADFGHTLDRQLDFVHQRHALEALAQDAESYDALQAAHVYGPLSTSKLLTVGKLDGVRLDNILSPPVGDADCDSLLRDLGFKRDELARLLCEVWLRQALLGRCFPAEPSPAQIQVLPGKRIAFTGKAFATLAAEPQANLWAHLVASANENPDGACFFLLKEMRREPRGLREEELRQKFRQAIPFRDGGWDLKGNCRSLAELLFVQWRFASESGYQPLMHLPGFFRGLFGVANIARQLAPGSDSVAEGLRDLRLVSGMEQFTRLLDRDQLSDQMDRYAALLMDLPQTLDQALTSAAQTHRRFKSQAEDFDDHRAGRSSSAIFAGLFLALTSAVIMSHYITASLVAGVWANRIDAALFLVFGALLLRAVTRVE
jgi:predicted unusual protein kinase regulating ubiquinone biosynthesis (AarF/ABC1/UbiB family)